MPKLNDWSEFINARILQEKGVLAGGKEANKQALSTLERLCAAYPQNSSFLRARAWSLSVLEQEEDAASSVIEAAYARLAHRLSGENDIAQDWIKELEKLKTTIGNLEHTKIVTSAMAW